MLISARRVSKFFGQQDVLRDVNFHMNPGEKVGLVGPNGSGKSTFFRILLGQVDPDRGEVHRARGLRMGYLPQDIRSLGKGTVLEHVVRVDEEVRNVKREMESLQRQLSSAKEGSQEALARRLAECVERYNLLGGFELRAKAEKVLVGLGFQPEDFHRSLGELSGGWAMRVALARLLVLEPELMLLDEPTNHLDIEALMWLEEFLMRSRSALLVISHDRTFLNKVVQRIAELEGGRLHSYTGNYDAYQQQKRHQEQLQWAAYKAQQERIRQLEAFIERNRARKDRARQVQSRIRMLEEMERVELPRSAALMHFRLPEAPPSGRIVVEMEGVVFGYREPMYRGASLLIERGSRIGVLGPNGCGKSTLLRLMAGRISPWEGHVRLGHGVRPSYFAQDQLELLHPYRTALEEAMDGVGVLTQREVRTLLGGLGFRGDDVFKRVSVLSGGEKSRLLLCKVLLAGANLLLLDEPTNHLDISSREVLESALMDFSGTLILVTHDRRLMNRLVDHVLEIKNGKLILHPGTYEDYTAKVKGGPPTPQSSMPREGHAAKESKKERRRREAQWRNRLHRARAPLLKAMEEVEREAEEIARRMEEISAELANSELYRSPERVRTLTLEHKELQKALEERNARWEQLAEQLEEMEERMERERP